MEPTCSMLGCNSIVKESTVNFFEFPRNFDMCLLWVRSCRRPDLMTDFIYEGAKAFINKFICSLHFSDSDFYDPNSYSDGLKESAVPILISSISNENHLADRQSPIFIKNEIEYDNSESYENTIDSTATQEPEITIPIATESHAEELDSEHVFIKEEFACDNVNSNVEYYFMQTENPLSGDDEQDCEESKNLSHILGASSETEENQIRSYGYDLSTFNWTNTTDATKLERNHADAIRKAIKRANETEHEKQDRRYKNAVRASVKRNMETPEQKSERRRKNAERVRSKRNSEPEDKKELRRLKDRIRSAKRRKEETPEQAEYRRYIDALRSASRRDHETDEQRQHRREADIARAALRKSNETKEQRERRLQSDRERSARRRTLTKFVDNVDQWMHLGKKIPSVNDIDALNNFCSNIKQNNAEDLNNVEVEDKNKSNTDTEFANLSSCDSFEAVNVQHSKSKCEDTLGYVIDFVDHISDTFKDIPSSNCADPLDISIISINSADSEKEDEHVIL